MVEYITLPGALILLAIWVGPIIIIKLWEERK